MVSINYKNIVIILPKRQIIMLTKRQFLALYDETVLGIRQIKNNNDKINKSIGILSQASLHKETQSERQMVENLFEKVEQLIQKMEKNYLDPDTARKIGVVKQQLRIQTDRRVQLIESVNEITKQFKQKHKHLYTPKEQQLVNNTNKNKRGSTTNSSIEMEAENYNTYKRSQITDIDNETNQTDHHQNSQVHMEMGDYDIEMERKLLQDKKQQLNYAHGKIISIQNIMKETENLVYVQGEKLDMIGDDIFHTYKNMNLANTELEEADRTQARSRKKYIVLSLMILLIVGGVIFFSMIM